MKLIRITTWAASKFEDVPADKTLWRWARGGRIWPPPKKVGRNWLVSPDARYVDRDDPVLGSVIYGTPSKKTREPATAR